MHEIVSTNVNIIVLCKNKVEVDVFCLLSGGLSAETAFVVFFGTVMPS